MGPRVVSSATAANQSFSIWLLLFASVAAVAPVWIPALPALTDLPQHAAQIALLKELADPTFPYRDLFELRWLTPYLADLLALPLVPAVGVVAAIKVVTSLALIAVPLTAALLMKETGTDRRWAFLTIPGTYGVSYQWGFLNFLIAVPLGLYLLTLAARQVRASSRRREFGIGALLLALFFSHVLACAFFGGIAGLTLLLTTRSLPEAVRRLWPLVIVAALVAVWLPGFRAHPLGANPAIWDLSFERLVRAPAWMLGLPPIISLVGALSIAALPFAAGGIIRPGLAAIPLTVCILTVFLAPSQLMAGTVLAERFAWFLLLFYFGVFEPPPRRGWPNWVWICCGLLVAGSIALASLQAARTRGEAASFVRMLDVMSPRQRAVWLPLDPVGYSHLTLSYLHFGAWYSAAKGGVVDPSMAATHTPLVRYKTGYRPAILNAEFELNPSAFDWREMNGEKYLYFMARSSTDPGGLIARKAGCTLRLVFNEDFWWLYERGTDCRKTGLLGEAGEEGRLEHDTTAMRQPEHAV